MLAGCVLATLVALLSFVLQWITLDAVWATILLGGLTLGLGGWPAAGLLFYFFVTGSLLSQSGDDASKDRPHAERRTGLQVWANGFWFAFFLSLWYILGNHIWWAAAAAAIATAAADTWATEFGSRFLWGRTILINGGGSVSPGTDGGISLIGTVAGLAAALITGLLALVFVPNMNPLTGWYIAGAGWIGCLADSWLGAVFQRSEMKEERPFEQPRRLDNDAVNGLATLIGAVVALILTQWAM